MFANYWTNQSGGQHLQLSVAFFLFGWLITIVRGGNNKNGSIDIWCKTIARILYFYSTYEQHNFMCSKRNYPTTNCTLNLIDRVPRRHPPQLIAIGSYRVNKVLWRISPGHTWKHVSNSRGCFFSTFSLFAVGMCFRRHRHLPTCNGPPRNIAYRLLPLVHPCTPRTHLRNVTQTRSKFSHPFFNVATAKSI